MKSCALRQKRFDVNVCEQIANHAEDKNDPDQARAA